MRHMPPFTADHDTPLSSAQLCPMHAPHSRGPVSSWRRFALLSLVGMSSVACSATQQRPMVATAFSNDEMRHESIEATLRVLDAHPEYIDELFERALQHPPTRARLLHDAAQHLNDASLARQAADELTAAPDGLKTTMVASFDAMYDRPPALAAAAEALEQRPDHTARIMVQRELAIRRSVRALSQELQRNPKAKRAFLLALQENSEAMAMVITSDPAVMAALLRAIGKAGVQRGSSEFETFLQKLAE